MKNEPGTYALLMRASAAESVEVGGLGTMQVEPGVYVYVGSAFGPGGLRARVQRHARGDGALHWHVDYLRTVTTLTAVWYTHDATRRECTWAKVLREHPEAHVPMMGFGASDCDCPAHLVVFEDTPSLDSFRRRLQTLDPGHASVSQVPRDAVLE